MKRILIVALSVLLSAVVLVAAEQTEHGPPPSGDPRFEFLKNLEGTWVGTGLDDEPGGRFEFRVTAGGHAVEEREMIGTPMEMLSVYYMQGEDLVATHYCMLGNQPRVVAAKKIVDDTLTFACAGTPGNAASHDEAHVHGWSIRLGGEGKLYYSAELVTEGTVTEAPAIVLSRE